MSAEEKRHSGAKSQAVDMDKWRVIVNEWDASKESQKGYCERLGINIHTFTYVRSKLLKNKKAKTSFMPIVIKSNKQEELNKAGMMTIENKQGLKLHVCPTLSLDQLAKIFKLCGWQHA